MIKHTELRCGNLHEYYIEDKHDERKAWWEVSVIDWNDLRYLEEHPEDNFYRFIPLSEEWLIRAGFEAASDDRRVFFKGRIGYELGIVHYALLMCSDDNGSCVIRLKHIKHLHQLQNLYFDYQNEELTFKDL